MESAPKIETCAQKRDRGTGAQQFRGLAMTEIHRRRPQRYKFEL